VPALSSPFSGTSYPNTPAGYEEGSASRVPQADYHNSLVEVKADWDMARVLEGTRQLLWITHYIAKTPTRQ
jgi:hypothetical protein